jgi:hypothetical protein
MGSGKMYCPGLSGVKLFRNHCWAKTGGKCVAYLPIFLIPAVDHCPDLDGKKRPLCRVQRPSLSMGCVRIPIPLWGGWAYSVPVPDHGSRDRDVVLVRRTICWGNPGVLGIWNGEGLGRVWGRGGQFTSNLGPRWTRSHHAKGGIPSK